MARRARGRAPGPRHASRRTGTATRAATLWLVTVTDAATGRPRHQAGALGRRQHPRRRADGHGRRLLPAPAPRRRPSRAGDPVVTEALRTRTFYVVPRVNPDGAEWALADPPRFRRSSMRPWPWADAHRWPGAHVEDVDGDGRVLQMRIPDPDGAWMAHPDDARLLVPGPARRRAGRHAPLPAARRGHDRRLRRLHDPDAAPARGPRHEPQLPGRLGHRACRGSGDHPLSRAGDRRPRAGHRRPPQRLRLQRLPHQRRGAAAAVVDGGRLGAAAGRRVGVEAARRDRHRAHRLHGALGLRGLHVGQVRHDERRRRRLGLRAPRRVLVDDRVLGRRPRAPPARSRSTDFWYLGPTDDQALAVLRWGDEHAPDQYVAWYPFEHPQLGPVELGGWHHARHLDQPAARSPARRGHAARPRSRSPRRWRRRAWRSSTRRPSTSAAAPGGSRSASPTPAGCRPTSRRAARKDQLTKPIVAELTGDGVDVVGGPARQLLGQLAGRARRLASGNGTTARPTGCWRRGSSGPRPAPRSTSPPPTSGPVGPMSTLVLDRERRAIPDFPIRFVANRGYARRRAELRHRHGLLHRPARGRGDHDLPRDRRRVRASRAAVLRRQGLRRHAPPRPPGVLAGADPVPGDARRHRPQLRRGHRVPRPRRRRLRRRAGRRLGAGLDRRRPGPRGHRPACIAQPAADRDAARRHRRAPLRRRVRRRPPRRGAGPGQGARRVAPRRVRPVGPEEPAARAVGDLQHPPPPRRAPARVPAVELDRARHLALHRRAQGRPAAAVLRPPARGVPPRRDADGRQPPRRAMLDGEEPFEATGALPHDRRRHVHGRGRVVGVHGRGHRRRDRASPGSPSAAPPAPTTGSPRPAWKTASARATSE